MLKYIVTAGVILHLQKRIKLFLLRRKIRSNSPLQIIDGAGSFFLERDSNDDNNNNNKDKDKEDKENKDKKNEDKKSRKNKNDTNKTGILLIHGFTSTTDEFKELGKYLHKKGYTVYCPLLSGHGTIKEHLYCVHPKEWMAEVQAGIKQLEKTCDSIYLIGCSFGGNLAILTANSSEKVKGIVTLGTPFIFRGDPLARILIHLIKPFKLFRKKRQTKKILEVYKKNKRISYKELPLGPLARVFTMIEASKKALPDMKKDILFIQANNDHIFNDRNLDYAFNKAGSKRKEICLVHDTIHVFIMDDKRWKVYEEIDNFIVPKRPTLKAI